MREEKFEIINNSINLVITIGDSWTWGDSLGNINVDQGVEDNILARQTGCYGRHLSDQLDADWINDARPGGSNDHIINKFEKHLNTDYSKYKKVWIIITLTETGRNVEISNLKEIDEELQTIEQNHLDKINALILKNQTINLIVGRNFTDYYPKTKLYPWCLEKTWVEVIFDQLKIENTKWAKMEYSMIKTTGIASGVGFMPLNKKYDHDADFKLYLINSIEKAKKLWTFLEISPYNSKKATKHPTKEAHQLWANYIVKNSLAKKYLKITVAE
jgi:hypothetical protein